MLIEFIKMHGCGNDFVVIDERDATLNLTRKQRVALADRRRGIGCDQLIILEHPNHKDSADLRLRIFNPDGKEVAACGNATRCVARWLADGSQRDAFNIEVGKRILHCQIEKNGKEFWVNMGKVRLSALSRNKANPFINLGTDFAELPSPIAVNIGNPHCIFEVESAESIDVAKWGSLIEMHRLFFPRRTNVEFVSPLSQNVFRLRVWERGAGITQACGSGAAAVAWALRYLRKAGNSVRLRMDGGDLFVKIDADSNIYIKGKTVLSHRGSIEL